MKAVRFLALGVFLAAMPASAQTLYYPPLSSQIDLSELPGDFARPVSGIVSVGLNAVELVSDT